MIVLTVSTVKKKMKKDSRNGFDGQKKKLKNDRRNGFDGLKRII